MSPECCTDNTDDEALTAIRMEGRLEPHMQHVIPYLRHCCREHINNLDYVTSKARSDTFCISRWRHMQSEFVTIPASLWKVSDLKIPNLRIQRHLAMSLFATERLLLRRDRIQQKYRHMRPYAIIELIQQNTVRNFSDKFFPQKWRLPEFKFVSASPTQGFWLVLCFFNWLYYVPRKPERLQHSDRNRSKGFNLLVAIRAASLTYRYS